jgi:hypothetical protein
MKAAEIPRTGADQADSPSTHDRQRKPGNSADVSLLFPEIALALAETEWDFLLGKIGNVTGMAEAARR